MLEVELVALIDLNLLLHISVTSQPSFVSLPDFAFSLF